MRNVLVRRYHHQDLFLKKKPREPVPRSLNSRQLEMRYWTWRHILPCFLQNSSNITLVNNSAIPSLDKGCRPVSIQETSPPQPWMSCYPEVGYIKKTNKGGTPMVRQRSYWQ
ncbi:hypothetical protein TNIN_487801 [Trichonephila inaurata madagascariensis]|uniref:Uncharacterized protein n=1 Tax=Trichonephila inaurata madagascariensis TaxID=2747483 RepID=A0A8X6WVD2_9ARAC|nr:hypothetical protein TNIN_487801 [Trichonephila inaurata madagascariensis]